MVREVVPPNTSCDSGAGGRERDVEGAPASSIRRCEGRGALGGLNTLSGVDEKYRRRKETEVSDPAPLTIIPGAPEVLRGHDL